jgi:DNA gyrase/topoisomerase IV subunit A
MQTNFPVHMLALVDNVPRLLDLKTALAVYIEHQKEIIQRRTEFRLRKAKEREHIVEGLVKALDMIDAIIVLIRGSADVETARAGLMATPFEFSEIQANFILDMALRRLTQLEGKKLRDELKELRATIKELNSILKDEGKKRGVVKTELTELRTKYGDDRRTKLTVDTGRSCARPHPGRRGRRRAHNGLHQDRCGRHERRQGRGGKVCAAAKATTTTSTAPHHDRALVPVAVPNRSRVSGSRTRSREGPPARGIAREDLFPARAGRAHQAVIDTRMQDGSTSLRNAKAR